MNNRSWLALLLIPPLTFAPRAAPAQTYYVPPPAPPSHRELPGGFDVEAGQAMMADRLKQLHELHQLQDQVQDLLRDPDFRDRLLSQFSEEQLRQLREKILRGDGLSRDRNWDRLLRQAASGQRMDERQIEVLRRWAERMDRQRAATPGGPSLLPGGSPMAPPPSSPANAQPPGPEPTASLNGPVEPSLWERFQEDVSDWFSQHVDLAGEVVNVLEELGVSDEGAPLADLLRSMRTADPSGDGWAERAAGLSDYLPDLAGFVRDQGGVWDNVRSVFRNAPMPSLPGPGLPSSSGRPLADGDSWGTGSLVLMALAVFLLLWWRMARAAAVKPDGEGANPWRLGAWPVSPDAVSTRQDVIRAFEYLALLRLGPDAGTHHHRDLAARLADSDGGGPARHQAAELLAWLYEQARYAPGTAPFTPDQLSEARHALRFLAGVTPA